MSGREDHHEVVKWYTRARKFPQLIGKTPDGARLWGGPYTYTQVVGAVVVLVAGIKTVGLWGAQLGLIGDAVVILSLAYATALALGRLPIGSRNPLSVAQGLLTSMSSARTGKYAGRPLKIRRPHRVTSRVVVNSVPPTVTKLASPPTPAAADRRPGRLRPRWSRPAPAQRPTRSTPAPARPAVAAGPPLTNVQRLLASAGPPREKD